MQKEKEPLVFTNKVDQQYMFDKKRKRKKAMKVTQLTWSLRVLFIVLLSAYLLSDYSKIKQISVFGNQAFHKEAILELSKLDLSTRYYVFAPYLVEQALKKSPLIEDVVVSRTANQVVKIEIVEKVIVGYVFIDQVEWLLGDGTTIPVEEGSMNYLGFVPYIDGFEGSEALLVKLAKQLLALDESTRSIISEIMFFPLDYDKEQLKLHMVDTNTVFVSLMYLRHVNRYSTLVNAINQKNVCIYFDSAEGRAYTSECLE